MKSPSRFGFLALAHRLLAAAMLALGLAAPSPVWAADSVIYTVTGVAVDATDKDAAQAKLKAISEAQVKAFGILAERLGGAGATERFKRLTPIEIGRMMSSLSIEEERTGPGRYIAKLTIRFLPRRIREVMSKAGISYTEQRAPPIVILPVWKQPDGPNAWQDNVWRKAWLDLNAENTLVPVIVPLGDLADTQTISAEEAIEGDKPKLDALRGRYSGEAILVAVAEPAGARGVHAVMAGETPLGRIGFDKTYEADAGSLEDAAALAAKRFHSALIAKWTKSREPAAPQSSMQVLSIAVPFASLEQWNALRANLMATPGVASVDVSSLSAGGAYVRLSFAGPLDDLKAALAGNRLSLALEGNVWVLRVL